MALKPGIVQSIRHGKLLSRAAFPFLVDTWNWITSAVNNLRGDGDNNGNGPIKVDWTRSDHPVIRFDATRLQLQQSATLSDPYRNFYFNSDAMQIMGGAIVIGRTPLEVEGTAVAQGYTGYKTIQVVLSQYDPVISWVDYSPFSAPDGGTSYLPCYHFTNGVVDGDYRGCFNVPVYE